MFKKINIQGKNIYCEIHIATFFKVPFLKFKTDPFSERENHSPRPTSHTATHPWLIFMGIRRQSDWIWWKLNVGNKVALLDDPV